MKDTFANARENLSDEQLKRVTGGSRGNSRPEPAGDHLIDYCNLHGAVVMEGYKLQAQPGSSCILEEIQLVDGNGDSGERENTTWPLPSATDGDH